MLKATVMPEDDYKSFFRPAVLDSLRQVLKFYGLDNASQIYYNGENEIAKLIGSNATDGPRGDMYTDGIFRNKIYIVTEYQQTEFNNGDANQRRMPTERPVWMNNDPEPMALYPGFSGGRVDVTVVGSFNSSKLAENYVRRINRLRSNQVTDMSFSATVHMGLNPSILELFSDVHGLLIKNDPATPEFGDWFNTYCQVPFTTIMNAAGNHKRLVVPMRLDNIGLQFSEPLIQRAHKGGNAGKFEVEFKYFFYFNEFTHWDLEYPLNIFQDEIPAKWIPRVQDQFKQPFNVRVNQEMAWGKAINSTYNQQAPYFLKLPDHDPWVMKKRDWIQPILQARLSVDDLPTQELANIFDIPGFKWNEQVKAYILRRRDVAFSHFQTPFPVYVFSNDMAVPPELLSMDENGTVSLLAPPTLKNTYRVVVTLDYAIRDYLTSFWDDLIKNKGDLNLLPAIFSWYNWNQLPTPWLSDIPRILKDIAQGTGLARPGFNNYMMNLKTNSYLLIEDLRHVTRY